MSADGPSIEPAFLHAVVLTAPGPVTFDAAESAPGIRAVFHVANDEDRDRSGVHRIVVWREGSTVYVGTVGRTWRGATETTLAALIEQDASARAEARRENAA